MRKKYNSQRRRPQKPTSVDQAPKKKSPNIPIEYTEFNEVGYKGTRVDDIYDALSEKPQNIKPPLYKEEIIKKLCLPQSLGMPRDIEEQEHERFRMAFDKAGVFDSFYSSLASHLEELGQYPTGGFMGYGALQTWAQEPYINRAVSVIADQITKNWIEFHGGEASDKERIEKLTDLVQNKYKLKSLFRNAIRKVGFYGGSLIFIDTGSRDDLTLPLPVSEHSTELVKGGHLSFKLIDPVNVSPCEYNAVIPLNADYMKPRSWWVMGTEVHASRLITLYEDEPPELLKPSYNFLGIPLAQKIADTLAHWKDSRVQANETLKKTNLLVLKTDVDGAFSTPGGVRFVDARLKWLQKNRDNNSVFLCDKETEDVQNVQNTIAGIADIVKMNREDFAAVVGVPSVILYGLSASGFNATGESDMQTYYEKVRSQQEIYRDQIQRCIDAIQIVHFGDIDPTISFDFVQVSPDNGSALAMTNSTKMTSICTAVQAGIMSAEEGREYLRRDPELNLAWLDEEMPEDMGDGDMDFEDPDGELQNPALDPTEQQSEPEVSTQELEELLQQGGD